MLEKIRFFTKNDAIRRTFAYYFLFICLGLDSAIIGPSLPAHPGPWNILFRCQPGAVDDGGRVGLLHGAPAMVYLVFGSLVLNLLAFARLLRLRPASNPSTLSKVKS